MVLYWVRLDTTLTVDETLTDSLSMEQSLEAGKLAVQSLTGAGGLLNASHFPKVLGLSGSSLASAQAAQFGFDAGAIAAANA